ncbi:MAG: ATP-binding protein, partial [Deltaproteobacteria bacterium]|nr:ATP-binding protein [Deltaproteobacteria bacterium]
LRQPIEDGVVTVARSGDTIRFPARFQLVAATNPCPCGFLRDRRQPCVCSEARLGRYRQRLSGPLIDRFDIRITVPRLRSDDLRGAAGEPSSAVRDRVRRARALQATRTRLNRELSGAELDDLPVAPAAHRLLTGVFDQGAVTGRGWDRVRRVARTIADLDGGGDITENHMA